MMRKVFSTDLICKGDAPAREEASQLTREMKMLFDSVGRHLTRVANELTTAQTRSGKLRKQ